MHQKPMREIVKADAVKNPKIGTCKTCAHWHEPTKYTPGLCSTRTGGWDADEFCSLWEKINGMKESFRISKERQKHFDFFRVNEDNFL